jgi:two-component system, cell cycle sensor histidine kinase and response regulator CckA
MARLFTGMTETILVVEDDPLVLGIVRLSLTHAGLTVHSAQNSEEARRIERDCAGPIHLLLSDVIMLHGNGPDLANELQARRPEMKVILMSGCPDDIRVLNFKGQFLQKPFLPDDLLRKVNQVLHGTAPARARSAA